MKIGIKWNNTERVMEKLKALEKSAPQAVVAGFMDLGEIIMDNAVARTPTQTGELRESAYIAPPSALGTTKTEVECGFGADHAVEVHEKTEVPHTTGEAKFLEKAVHEKAQGNLYVVANKAEKHLLKGTKPKSKYPEKPRKS